MKLELFTQPRYTSLVSYYNQGLLLSSWSCLFMSLGLCKDQIWTEEFFVSGDKIQKPMLMPTIFLSLYFHLPKYTNPNILMSAKQQALTLFL